MKRKKLTILRNTILFGLGSLFLFVGILAVWVARVQLPDFSNIDARQIANSTKIYDRTGTIVLYDVHKNSKRTDIAFADMGENIKKSTIAIEDDTFYTHHGIRPFSILRAMLANTFLNGHQGGSTITQQVVKNVLLTKDRTFTRKLKEWVLAIKIEQVMDKDQILELYLNEAPYGGTVYGVKEASRMFFGKDPKDITIAEASYLAAIPKGPTLYSPYGRNRQLLEDRKNSVLEKMHTLKVITEAEYTNAKNEKVVFLPASPTGIKAPHFVFFVREYLENRFGPDVLESSGLQVITTLDYDLQQKAEEIVSRNALKNAKDWNASNQGLVAMDPNTGQILAMVGSRNYFDKEIDGAFNIATAHRQPGSSFKPFVYATAFNKGYTPDTVVFDVPTEFSTLCNAYGVPNPGHTKDECYMPDDYDNLYKGPINLRSALDESRNIPAVKMLYLAGIDDSLRVARSMGVNLVGDKNQYGLTLVLGGGEASLLDMVSGYSSFATGGTHNNSTPILSIKDNTGTELEKFSPNPIQVLPKQTALLISDVLSDNNARIPTFGAHSALYIDGYQIAAKTGTTNNNKDAWLIGYTPTITVGVWSGNNDNTSMKKGGAALAGPSWNEFMRYALTKYIPENFEKPNPIPSDLKAILRGKWQGGESFVIDKISGKLATNETPNETREEYVIPNVHDTLYWINKNDPTGPNPIDPSNDSQFNHWETATQNWWAKNSYKFNISQIKQKPSAYDDVHISANKPQITITSPISGSTFKPTDSITITLNNTGVSPLKKFDVYINNIFIGTSENSPLSYTFTPTGISSIQNTNTIRVIGTDSVYNKGEATTTFNVNQ